MRLATGPALLATTLLVPSCFKDVDPGDSGAGETSTGHGDGEPGDGDGDPDDGDGDPTGDGDGDGDGDDEPGDGDGDPGCQPGDCAANQYCIAGVCEDPPEGMVAIEAGPFWMGCNEEIDSDCNADEYPYHEVTLSAYAIDRTEVSADAYYECVNEGHCTEPITDLGNNAFCNPTSGMLPITCVTWFQARDYCEWRGKQLPTEAQWEKAARGDDGRLYPWGNQPPTCTHATTSECGGGLRPVGSLPAGASPYGVLDMADNVMEWTADWYGVAYYLESPAVDPTGPATGTLRTVRSGLPLADTSNIRNSRRSLEGIDIPPDSATMLGIRCAYVPQ